MVCCCNRLEWANAHNRQVLALWRGVVTVWAGTWYGQRMWAHFINGIVNADWWSTAAPFHCRAAPWVTWMTRGKNLYTTASTLADVGVHGHVTHWECLGCSGSADTTACSCSSNTQQRCTAIEEEWPTCTSTADHLFVREMCCAPSEPNKQQVLAYNVSEGWGHTNDATPEACWQVCCAGGWSRPPGCGCLPLTDIDFLRGRALTWCAGDYHALPPDTCCVWGTFRRLKPDPDVHLQT